MNFTDLLVYVRLDASPAPLAIAAQLAKRHGAHLTGLCALYGVALAKKIGRNRPSLADAFVKDDYENAAAAEKHFRDVAEKSGVSHAWVRGEGYPTDLLNAFGLLQDLVVLEQAAPDSSEIDPDVVEDMVLTRGQATLVVPNKGTVPVVGERIVIAWNGSREAAAAVRAARPLISKADSVVVLRGRSRERLSPVTHLSSPDTQPLDIGAYLRRLTKAVDVENFDVDDAEAGPAILDRASRLSADLVVMGAYGRPWLSQRILGGSTRHVLKNMTVPTLFSR